MQKSSVSNKISLHLRHVFCQLQSLSHEYENFYNTFMTDDRFFDSAEAEDRENKLSNFIYWCLSEPRLGTRWIARLAKFVELQSEVAFGRYDLDPLNLWTVLVYLCCILNQRIVQIGVEVFDIYEFTRTYVFDRLIGVLGWERQSFFSRELDIHDVYFLTHVVYVLTDYCNFEISSECFQKYAVFFSRVINNLLKFMRSRIQPCYVECLCEIHRNFHFFISVLWIQISIFDSMRQIVFCIFHIVCQNQFVKRLRFASIAYSNGLKTMEKISFNGMTLRTPTDLFISFGAFIPPSVWPGVATICIMKFLVFVYNWLRFLMLHFLVIHMPPKW